MTRSNKRSAKAEATDAKPRRDWLRIALVVVLTVGVAGAILWLPTPGPDLRPLLGRWRRQGDEYVLVVAQPTSGGPVQAEYFNPKSIHVEKTEAEWKENKLHLFVELQDTGYPGSTYTLTYDPQRDVLTGRYFQAGTGSSYDVTFERLQ